MTEFAHRIAALRDAGRLSRTPQGGFAAVVQARLAEDVSRPVVIDGHCTLSRGDLHDLACRLGTALMDRGVMPGAAIAFQLPNWWEACVINLTAALFGYRLVPLLTIYRAAELGVMFPACAPQAVFVPESYRGFDHVGLVKGVPGCPALVVTVRGQGGSATFDSLLAAPPATPVPATEDDVKMILFTSGSTGRPKGVLHSHGAMEALIRRTTEFWDIGVNDRMFVPSPIGHVGGSLYAFEFPWISGCTAVLAERWNADEAVAAIEDRGATFMAGATPFLSGLIEAAERADTALPGLRRFICGGASVPPELVRRGLSRLANAVVSRAYGSTEVPLVCPGIRSRAEAEERAGTDGEIVVDIAILTADDQPVTEGRSGEIGVRGPQMLVGYLDPADERGAYTPDGYFRMGDLGRRVDGRFLEITGRTKEIIIRKGENLSPLEIENALSRHPRIRQAAVVGIPCPDRGEMVVAFVLPADGARFDFDEMVRHLDRLGLARQKFPERLHVVTELPVNTVGKVRKPLLREIALLAEAEAG